MHFALFLCNATFPHYTFLTQKEVVCMTHLWGPKKEGEKG